MNVPLSVNVQLKVTYVPCIDVTFASVPVKSRGQTPGVAGVNENATDASFTRPDSVPLLASALTFKNDVNHVPVRSCSIPTPDGSNTNPICDNVSEIVPVLDSVLVIVPDQLPERFGVGCVGCNSLPQPASTVRPATAMNQRSRFESVVTV